MPSVFISRSKERAASFISAVQPFSSRIIAESLIDFKPIKGGSLPNTDWLFFYSQTGADHFFRQYSILEIHKNGFKIATFGKKTGAYIQERYHAVEFIGDGVANSTAEQFVQEHQSESVCIVRGLSSVNSLFHVLSPICQLEELIVYENTPKTSVAIDKTDIVVFTSPMNLETYFEKYAIDQAQKVLVIGATTAMSALNNGIDTFHISKLPSMESLADSTMHLCQTWSDI